jgi:hypothetical protein
MIEKYCGGLIPAPAREEVLAQALQATVDKADTSLVFGGMLLYFTFYWSCQT